MSETMSDELQQAPAVDPVVDRLRAEISELDRTIVELVNRRLNLVERIKARKTELGVDFVDLAREAEMLRNLEQSNGGPLSAEGVAELHAAVLALTKREVYKL
jgi:chorismate mutase